MTKYKVETIDVCYLANGNKLSLPVHNLIGMEGPTVGISAAIHGDEIIGVEVIRQLINILKDQEIKGTIRFLPVANPLAFETLTRHTPIDGNNLNRLFPGDPNGQLSSKLASKITEEFLNTIDIFIDIHAGGAFPIVDYVYILNDEEFSRAFGSKVLYRPKVHYEGTTAEVTIARGVPSVTLEVGGGPNTKEHIRRNVDGILNMLRQKGVIEGEVKHRDDQIVMTEIANILAGQGGLMVPNFEFDMVNKVIEGRQLLATTYNPLTYEVVEEIYTPFEKNFVILMRGQLNKVHPGDYAFMIGNLDTAEGNE
ncbi:succinate dehydrogenase [Compostibacillus humi]|uniref:Succinate dehydrogenase n=1 Tax=Compostibacillus humi TaxID=1245525 RepID=A0A8J2TMM5_9BACI|nr:M14 family metallopeptidase [Compostibacillus humi]GFZ82159.1 succinate dehydrogenase [Compostibacillus humi]